MGGKNIVYRKKEIDSKITLVETKYNLFQYASAEDRVETIRQNDSEKQVFSQNLEEIEEVKIYQEVVINQSIREETIVEEKMPPNHKVKSRTYRGVVY
jgi:DNA-binding protein H-NS